MPAARLERPAPAPEPHDEEASRFRLSGPMRDLLAQDVEAATPAQALASVERLAGAGAAPASLRFSVVVDLSTGRAEPARVTWRVASGSSEVELTFEGLRVAGSTLRGGVRLRNAGSLAVEGVRLDLLGAIRLDSPLHLGDLAPGEETERVPFTALLPPRAAGSSADLQGALTGFVHVREIPVDGVPVELASDLDAVYTCTSTGAWRLSAGVMTRVPGSAVPCAGIAWSPDTGVLALDDAGALSGIRPTAAARHAGFDLPATGLRIDPQGRACTTGAAATLVECDLAGHHAWHADVTGARLFDYLPGGSLLVAAPPHVLVFDPGGHGRAAFALGPEWHLGAVLTPVGVRVDPAGFVWVLEDGLPPGRGESAGEAARVSVLDAEGRVVRVLGRASREPSEAGVVSHALSHPVDAAFLAGHAYLLDGGTSTPVIHEFVPLAEGGPSRAAP